MSWFPRLTANKEPVQGGPTMVPFGQLHFAPLPLEAERNDIYAEGYTWPKGNADRYKWYNNTFWGNRLPDSGVGIGIPGLNAVSQKMFWTQSSPEQKSISQWNLKGGPYPYYTSVQQNANIIQRMTDAWRSATANQESIY